jgi:hypothetical protein
MVLGLEFYFDLLFLGSNKHVGCVALCISFPKCPRSSKSYFGAKSGLFRGCDRTLALGHDRTHLCHCFGPRKAEEE